MAKGEARFDAIEHTADVGYRLFAPTLAELFAIAGRALFATITDIESIAPALSRKISVSAADPEGLLVGWLAELNYRFLTAHELFGDFSVEDLTPTSIRAVASGEHVDLSRHDIHTEIKAVTYHGLYLRQSPEGWEAQVIFDV